MPTLKHTIVPYLKRRQALLEQLGDSVAIIPTAPEYLRNRDTHHAFRFDSYFWYLSGFAEPEAVIVLLGACADAPAQSLLFCREKNLEREIWDGFRYGPAAAKEAFGFDQSFAIEELDARLPDLIASRKSLCYAVAANPVWDTRIGNALQQIRAQTRAGKRAPEHITDLRAILDPMRRVKDAHEIALMTKAAQIASSAHQRAMKSCRPGLYEYQLEAEISHEFRISGASGHSFLPIVAGGKNACVLHYIENDQVLKDGDLVLIDAGCEYAGYAADISRTFPVNGRFSGAQRAVYEVVLAAQAAAIAAVRPGVSFNDYHQAALRALVEGLCELKLLTGNVDGLIESEAYKAFYMHRAGHWLGLDVHDAGEYKNTDGTFTQLVSGMILTVEPGLYIRAAAGVPEHFHGIGIRIEDDVLVGENGPVVYTNPPKSIADIEETMRRA